MKRKSKKVIIIFSILFIFLLIFIFSSCTNVNKLILNENSSLIFSINWNSVIKNKINRYIPSETDGIVISIKSLNLNGYIKSLYINKNDNETKILNLYPGDYVFIIFAITEINKNNKKYFKMLSFLSNKLSLLPDETKSLNIELALPSFNFSIEDLSNFKPGKSFKLFMKMDNFNNFFYLYSFKYYLDFNNENENFKELIYSQSIYKKDRITADNINFTFICTPEKFYKEKAKILVYLKLNAQKDNFEVGFYEKLDIYGIYFELDKFNTNLIFKLPKTNATLNITIK